MKAFSYVRPTTVSEAVQQLTVSGRSNLALAGGVDSLDLMKERLYTPDVLVSLNAISGLDTIETLSTGVVRIGARVLLSQLAADTTIQTLFPALASAASGAATPQIRNMATIGGNLLQRPRCWYFRRSDVDCLKKTGTDCPATVGDNRYLAIFGGNRCYAVTASSPSIALTALEAKLNVTGPSGSRVVSIDALYQSPSVDPTKENTLTAGEVITSIDVTPLGVGSSNVYHKIRHKEAFDWAMSEVAVRLTISAGKVTACRIVIGAVAPIPWRATSAETSLINKTISTSLIQSAAALAVADAKPLSMNAYKVPVTQTLVEQVLTEAAGL